VIERVALDVIERKNEEREGKITNGRKKEIKRRNAELERRDDEWKGEMRNRKEACGVERRHVK
jgi:hypothetical protein